MFLKTESFYCYFTLDKGMFTASIVLGTFGVMVDHGHRHFPRTVEKVKVARMVGRKRSDSQTHKRRRCP